MRCLVVVTDPERDRGLVDVATSLAGTDEVTLTSVIEVPEDDTLASAQTAAREQRRALRPFERPGIRVHVTVARRGWAAVEELVAKDRPDLLVVAWRRPGWDFLGTTIEQILREPPCDVAIVKGSFARVRRLLVPVRGGRYAQLAARLATTFARARDGSVSLLHVESGGGRRREDLYQILGEVTLDERVDQLLTRIGDPAEVIAEEAKDHDAVVIGATGREGSDPLGPIGQAIVHATRPALLVRTRAPVASSIFAERRPLPTERGARSRAVGELVDTWFVENTFSSSEFADLGKLVSEKERQRLRISVVLPTLNEEATIRKVVRAIRSRLVERFPLVDELIVMDSDSQDRTREIAAAEGVPVHIHQETLPECGAHRGKGEAMWKSLHVTTGDLVIWIDTDIANIHPKFVYGIVGPLLRHPRLQFVKAFYQRPLRFGQELQATGGGRVTELTARPILNLFYPELSGMVQPLSGEQGGRRSHLEQLPFFTGYGVETGLLIDSVQRAGIAAIAQVDMKQRIHRNQSLYSLSKMSFEILQVALKRVGEARGVHWEDANSTMKLILPGDDGRLQLTLEDLVPIERPPIATLPTYAAAHR
jgi:nucleotide-binding universal stress UspA family protein